LFFFSKSKVVATTKLWIDRFTNANGHSLESDRNWSPSYVTNWLPC
jgi:hypothetical protein